MPKKTITEAHYDQALSKLQEIVVGGNKDREAIKQVKKTIKRYEKKHCPERRAARKKS